jgi:hypothetical protein
MNKIAGLTLGVFAALFLFSSDGFTQQSAAAATATVATTPAAATTVATTPSAVPKLVNYSGVLTGLNGEALTDLTGVTFLLYSNAQGGAPLWMETQNVQPDKTGHFSVNVGSTTPQGLPADAFVSGEARWLAVQIAGQPEQPRVLLVAVPYALKAADAETINGLPASAFVLAAPAIATGVASANSVTSSASGTTSIQPPVGGTGTADFIPLWTSTTNLGSSVLFQLGTGTSAKIGINTITPASPLDINGGTTFRGALNLVPTSTATASAGKNSQFTAYTSSAFNSSTNKAVAQNFHLQAEPVANNTANASGSLNLLFGAGSTAPVETGLKIANTGIITFATGQTFPGGGGTITGVKAGTDLTGGGTSGMVTLNLDTTKVPQLSTTNTFAQPQIVNSAGTSIQATSPATAILGTMTTNDFFIPAISGVSTATGSGLTIGVQGMVSTDQGYGVYGASNTNGVGVYGISSFGIGVIGVAASSAVTSKTTGVLGFTNGPQGVGIHGYGFGPSAIGNPFGAPVGVWADTSGTTQTSNAGAAALTTADNGWSIFSINASTTYPTDVIENWETSNSGSGILLTYSPTFGGICSIDVHGDLGCSGSKSAVVPVDSGTRKVALYAVEAPENWFEDAGSGALAGGTAVISLEKIFAQTVNTDVDYHVFLTPNGDCNGLYVTRKTANSFEVHELGRGKSSVGFDYRIMARRKGYEDIRLADKTKQFVPPPDLRKGAGSSAAANLKPAADTQTR